MSEPMTSGEIEDVLSSIRKLVSEDLRPQPRVQAPPRNLQPEPDKLILTPALRVVEGNAEAEATIAATDPAAPEPAPSEPAPSEPARRLRLDTVVAAFAAGVTPPADGWEAETGDATVTRLVRPPAPVAEAVARVEPFPDAAAADDSAIGGAVADHDLPDDDMADVVPPSAMHFAWQARRAGIGDDVGDGAGDPPPSPEVLGASEDASDAPMHDVDTDALADLVRTILREELQGALGERMTRNIRKLVRAEVARVLATKDLA